MVFEGLHIPLNGEKLKAFASLFNKPSPLFRIVEK
jgi:hypothetical protein